MSCWKESLPSLLRSWDRHVLGTVMRCDRGESPAAWVSVCDLSWSRSTLSFWASVKVWVCLQQDNLFQPERSCCLLNAWGISGTQWDRRNESILCQRDWDLIGLYHIEIRNKVPPFSLIASCKAKKAWDHHWLQIISSPQPTNGSLQCVFFSALNSLRKSPFVPNRTSEVFFSLFYFLSHWILIAQSSVIFTKVIFIFKTYVFSGSDF